MLGQKFVSNFFLRAFILLHIARSKSENLPIIIDYYLYPQNFDTPVLLLDQYV